MVGVGMAGALIGALSAAVIHAPAGAPGGATAPAAARAGESQDGGEAWSSRAVSSSRLVPVLLALEGAHRRFHRARGAQTQGAASGKAMGPLPAALMEAIEADGGHPDARIAFHREVGPGALVDSQGLTKAARALMERIDSLARHGLDPATYGMPGLAKRIEDAQGAWRTQGFSPPAGAGAAGAVLVDVLREPRFDRDVALARLTAAGGQPTARHVEAVLGALEIQRRGAAATTRASELEAALGKALLQIVLDFRFVKRAGPFELTAHAPKLLTRDRVRRKVLLLMAKIVRSADPESELAGLEPNHPSYEGMKDARDHYASIVARGGCSRLPETWKLRPEMEGAPVRALQERLTCEGYYQGALDGIYGTELLGGVRAYQAHHELKDDGFVFERSVRSMNVAMTRRLEQIDLALKRMRESERRDLTDPYLRVNLPLFEMHVVEGGKTTRRHRVIVGSNKLDDDKVQLRQGHINRTLLFKTRLYEAVVHPDWIVPRRVEQGEMKTLIKEDPTYLDKHNIVRQTLPGGRQVLIQRSGRGNALGKVKFLLEKSQAIFLHDTDKPEYFRLNRRDLSHGCMRVHRALDFANWLLVQDGWDADEVRRSLKASTTQRGMKLHEPVDLVTQYMTVDIARDGKPIFLTDIYGYDAAYRNGDLPPKDTALWGSPVLRPSWVPKVPEEIVMAWKEAGRSAPHNYDPARHDRP